MSHALANWWCRVATFLLVVGIVLSPLRAVGATIPLLIAYEAAVLPTTTTVLGAVDVVRLEAEPSSINEYDGAHPARYGSSNPHVFGGMGAVHAYDDALELTERREPTKVRVFYLRSTSHAHSLAMTDI